MRWFLFVLPLLLVLVSCGDQSLSPEDVNDTPSNLVLMLLSEIRVQLSWDDNSENETGFLIQRKEEGGDFQTIFTTTPDVSQYLDEDVEEMKHYYYRVAALYEEGMSTWSNTASIYTQNYFSGLSFGSDQTLEIVTWNLENFPKNDEITLNYVTQAIMAIDADIYALQEIESNSAFNQLKTALDAWEGYRANSASYGINLAYLYKTAVIDIMEIYEIYEEDSYAFPRSPLVMECLINNRPLVIINNHLKAQEQGNDDENRRRLASQKLEEYIDSYFPSVEVIMLGDLNDEISEPEEDNVFWNFIEEPEYYLFTDMEIALGDPSFWSYPGWPSHIDHILITNELFGDFSQPSSTVTTLRLDLYLEFGWAEYDDNISDHRPVGLKLAWDRETR
ncbi:MAG: endonuclease/exonuclease/phosphatase family protein [Candidatus Cloacimonetes bacterium]|nr:endonuclease/exonuclease/phosphatase family protein [Candidatus Cloacimonadota bacterium]